MITDDSLAEQKAVRLVFRGLEEDKQEVDHFLYRKHSKRTLKRELGGKGYKKLFEHLYKALYYRYSAPGYIEEINAIIATAPDSKKEYIRRE